MPFAQSWLLNNVSWEKDANTSFQIWETDWGSLHCAKRSLKVKCRMSNKKLAQQNKSIFAVLFAYYKSNERHSKKKKKNETEKDKTNEI